MNTVDAMLATAVRAGIDRLDSQLLLLHAWNKTSGASQGARRAWLLAHGDHVVPDAVQSRFETLVQRRAADEPLAYLTGRKEFFGLDLAVDARVLVPRPDTELLVEWALEVLDNTPVCGSGASPSMLDLGTGSGAVALAVKHARPLATVHAVDASADALAVAQANADRLQLDVRFLSGHWLQPVTVRYDCIASNPPYVAAGDWHLPALRHEPLHALVSGADGMQDIRAIVADAAAHLAPAGWLLIEHGHTQGPAVRTLFAAAGFGQVGTRRDLAGQERCTGGRVIAGAAGTLVK